ncbi:MAG TPA: ferrous iron transport protein B [Ignavibacteriaceae bacterium]|nr:ferrous iron transport protein B [Ignavibacteriaceae bacterium]
MNTSTLEELPLISLVGPPNSGKTTLFNYLSGKNFKTANYPGATVEYSIAKFQKKYGLNADLLDSPGIVSLSPESPDEIVAVNSLFSHPRYGSPDLVVVTVDTSQISRHLLLVKQLIDAKFNIIIVLTMVDILNKKGFDISEDKLSSQLMCRVIKIDGRTGKGTENLIEAIEKNLTENKLLLQPPVMPGRNHGSEWLIESYKFIETIEEKIIVRYSGNGKKPELESANSKLIILNEDLIRDKIVKLDHRPDSFSVKIDQLLLHRLWGLAFFFFIMALTFTSIFWLAEPLMRLVDEGFALLSLQSAAILGNNWFSDLISNGIISGGGAVLVFVPQILILFLILGLLEDSGYLARGAMLIDKPLSKIGLNGRSFVPMISGFACAIPAIMATRTIPNRKERFLTIFILPLMSCSARLPVYALLIAFLLPSGKSWLAGAILALIYIFSISSSIIVAGIINKFKKTIIKEEDNSSFILELPAYRRPKFSIVLNNTYNSAKVYVRRAGPIILVLSLVLWFLTHFPNYSPKIDTRNISKENIQQAEESERLSGSYAASMGKLIQPVMRPLGMDWRVGVSLISTFAAREVFVSSLALIFKVTSNKESIQYSIIGAMKKAKVEETGAQLFTISTVIGLIVFFIFALQCLSTVAISRKETGGWRIPILQIVLFSSTAYFLAFLVVNGLRALGIN